MVLNDPFVHVRRVPCEESYCASACTGNPSANEVIHRWKLVFAQLTTYSQGTWKISMH